MGHRNLTLKGGAPRRTTFAQKPERTGFAAKDSYTYGGYGICPAFEQLLFRIDSFGRRRSNRPEDTLIWVTVVTLEQ